jgi:hypothetical protein
MTQAPETRYARAADGIHVGYQVVGSGPADMVFVPYDYSNIEAAWDFPPFVSFVMELAQRIRTDLDRRHRQRGTLEAAPSAARSQQLGNGLSGVGPLDLRDARP